MDLFKAKVAFTDIMVRKESVGLFGDVDDRLNFAMGLASGLLATIERSEDYFAFLDWSSSIHDDIIGGFVFR